MSNLISSLEKWTDIFLPSLILSHINAWNLFHLPPNIFCSRDTCYFSSFVVWIVYPDDQPEFRTSYKRMHDVLLSFYFWCLVIKIEIFINNVYIFWVLLSISETAAPALTMLRLFFTSINSIGVSQQSEEELSVTFKVCSFSQSDIITWLKYELLFCTYSVKWLL